MKMKSLKSAAALLLAVLTLFTAFCAAGCNQTADPGTESTVPGTTGVLPGQDGTDPAGTEPGAPGADTSEADPGTPGTEPGVTPGTDPGTDPGTPAGPGVVPLGNFELTGVKEQPADGIGTPGKDFRVLESGPVQGWSDAEPAPGFNPLGDREKYAYVEYNGIGGFDVYCLADDGVTPMNFTVHGEKIGFSIENEDVTRNWLLYLAREKGAVIYPSAADKAVFSFREDENTTCWCVCQLRDDGRGAYVNTCRVLTLESGKTLEISTDSEWWAENECWFYTPCTEGKMQSLTLEFPDPWEGMERGFTLQATQYAMIGESRYSYTKSYSWDTGVLAPRLGDTIVYDNIPRGPVMTQWRLEKGYAPEGNVRLRLTLTDTEEISAVTWGEEIGLLKFRGARDMGIRIESPWRSDLPSHPEMSYPNEPFRDEEGDYCFLLPAGYYNARVGGSVLGDFDFAVQMIAVSAGRITEVTLPEEFSAAAGALISGYGSMEAEAGNMEIQSVEISADGKTGVAHLLIHDPQERDVFPEKDEFTIAENGAEGKILSVERQAAPVNVVLCLDSSGSMEGNMEAAVAAAVKFVENLPDNASVSLIQFEQNLHAFPGETKAEVIAALKTVKAIGATSLYDATDAALKKLEGKERPYVVVFSDGADSREPGVAGTGSSISKEQICERIAAAEVTVLTIGFGAGHDPATLKMMSGSSVNGAYFMAADKNALDGAFAAVAAKFGNQFTVTYERPVISRDVTGDVPVVSMVMDVSGSMNRDPASDPEADLDWRIDRVRGVFHDFVLGLPDGALMQFAGFGGYSGGCIRVNMDQVTTDSKALVLSALAATYAEGGTPIMEALDMAYASLSAVPSSKRVMVFFTDAALAVEDDGSGAQQMMFEESLKRFKDADIRVLFAGLGGESYARAHEKVFADAAALAGGDYIITSSVEAIDAKLKELLTKVNVPVSSGKDSLTVKAALECRTGDGSRMAYSAVQTLKDVTMQTAPGKTVTPGVVEIRDGGAYIRYDKTTSGLLYGSSPKEDTHILFRTSFEDAAASNSFAELRVTEAYLMDKFRGLEKSYSAFLALNVELTFVKQNKTDKEVGYQIPSIFNHFYVSFNNGKMMPASQATWLAETPFVTPGDPGVTVMEKKDEKGNPLERGETVSGVVIFLLDGGAFDEWRQLSFHFYDVSYGHIEIPLVGAMPQGLMEMGSLPQNVEKLSDSFDLSLTGLEDVTELCGVSAAADAYYGTALLTEFRVLEITFRSKVQALLELDPMERFYYRVPTDSGDFLIKMNAVVNNLPLGFTGSTRFAPASVTPVRMPYLIPTAVKDAKASLWADLASGSMELTVKDGKALNTGAKGTKYDHEFFTLTVNELAYTNEYRESVVLDFTVTDKKDGEGTGGFEGVFSLKRDVSGWESSGGSKFIGAVTRKGLGDFSDYSDVLAPVGVVYPSMDETEELIFGAVEKQGAWGAFDGQSRRGLLIFRVPYDQVDAEWTLTCDLIPDVKMTLKNGIYSHPELLAEKEEPETDDEFAAALEKAVTAAVERYRATHPETEPAEKVGLTDDEILGDHLPAPSVTSYGTQVLESVKTMEDFDRVMRSVVWYPDGSDYGYAYAPESVLTQGWGTDCDLYRLAQVMLAKLGYTTRARRINTSHEGYVNLLRWCGMDEGELNGVDLHTLGLSYTDEKGASHVYVPAFRRELKELYGLCTLSEGYASEPTFREVTLTVDVVAEVTGDAAMGMQTDLFGALGAAMGGGDGEDGERVETVNMLMKTISVPDTGRGFIDISFVSLGKSDDGIHDKVAAAADTETGLLKDESLWLDTKDYVFKRILVTVGDYTHTYILQEGEDLTDVFITLGYFLPELREEAKKTYTDAVTVSAAAAEKTKSADNYGTGRWVTHAAAARLISDLGALRADAEKQTLLLAKHIERPLVLTASLVNDGDKTRASMDLVNITPNYYATPALTSAGYEFNERRRMFNAAYGYAASAAEGLSCPGTKSYSYLDVWAALPEGTEFLTVNDTWEAHEEMAELLTGTEFPEIFVEHLKKQGDRYAYLIPTKPAVIDGRERWAWLEINGETFETVSVFDTGEHSGLATYIFGLTPKGMCEFTVGAIIGLDCSLLGVSAYSLTTEDPDEIMKSAGELMKKTYGHLTGFKTGMDYAGMVPGIIEGNLAGTVNDAVKMATNIDVMTLYKRYGKREPAGDSPVFGEPSFTDGFKAVVEAYFNIDLDKKD